MLRLVTVWRNVSASKREVIAQAPAKVSRKGNATK